MLLALLLSLLLLALLVELLFLVLLVLLVLLVKEETLIGVAPGSLHIIVLVYYIIF